MDIIDTLEGWPGAYMCKPMHIMSKLDWFDETPQPASCWSDGVESPDLSRGKRARLHDFGYRGYFAGMPSSPKIMNKEKH